jgi:thymidylate synthase (FAD)
MKIIKPSIEILTKVDGNEILKIIEIAGRTCYKSEANINEDSSKKFVKMLIERGHEAMIEHYSITIKFICDRGVSHEIVRHRIASYAQESTRYCDYNKDQFGNQITYIQPCWFKNDYTNYSSIEWRNNFNLDISEELWLNAMLNTEKLYKTLTSQGWKAQEARSVLPNSLKTEIVVTMNLREWRHFFKLRTAKAAHPQMREVAIMALNQIKEIIPVVFDDITIK